jgi:hypothetical protein
VESRIMVLPFKVTKETTYLTERRKLTREHSTIGKLLVSQRYKRTTVLQRQVDMRIKLGLLNVSFEFSLNLNRGNAPDTSDVSSSIKGLHYTWLPINSMTRWRTSSKETKAYPTIYIPVHYINWRYPKRKRHNRLWSKDLKISHGYGASVVVKYGKAVIMAKGRSYCVPKLKLIREENLK